MSAAADRLGWSVGGGNHPTTIPKEEPTMPELAWWWSQTGPTSGYQPWDDDEPLDLPAGSAVWVRVAATSEADMDTIEGHTSFIVPADVEVARFNSQTFEYTPPMVGAENPTVGRAPKHEVKFFHLERKWSRSFTWMAVFLVVVPAGVTEDCTLLYVVNGHEEQSSKRTITVAR